MRWSPWTTTSRTRKEADDSRQRQARGARDDAERCRGGRRCGPGSSADAGHSCPAAPCVGRRGRCLPAAAPGTGAASDPLRQLRAGARRGPARAGGRHSGPRRPPVGLGVRATQVEPLCAHGSARRAAALVRSEPPAAARSAYRRARPRQPAGPGRRPDPVLRALVRPLRLRPGDLVPDRHHRRRWAADQRLQPAVDRRRAVGRRPRADAGVRRPVRQLRMADRPIARP